MNPVNSLPSHSFKISFNKPDVLHLHCGLQPVFLRFSNQNSLCTFYNFPCFPDRPWGPPSLLYNGYRVFPGGKAAEAWCWPPTPSMRRSHERVGLYLYSPSGPSWPVIGRTFYVSFYTEINYIRWYKRIMSYVWLSQTSCVETAIK